LSFQCVNTATLTRFCPIITSTNKTAQKALMFGSKVERLSNLVL
jgi:hypothetical protein